MPKREPKTPGLNELRKTLGNIETVIQDNLQNLKDCERTLKEVKKLLEPPKMSWFEFLKKRNTK